MGRYFFREEWREAIKVIRAVVIIVLFYGLLAAAVGFIALLMIMGGSTHG